jgi:hypothetical protein
MDQRALASSSHQPPVFCSVHAWPSSSRVLACCQICRPPWNQVAACSKWRGPLVISHAPSSSSSWGVGGFLRLIVCARAPTRLAAAAAAFNVPLLHSHSHRLPRPAMERAAAKVKLLPFAENIAHKYHINMEQKPTISSSGDPAYVNLKVREQEYDSVTHFRMKRVCYAAQEGSIVSCTFMIIIFANVVLTRRMQLIDSYCQRQSMDSRCVRYYF